MLRGLRLVTVSVDIFHLAVRDGAGTDKRLVFGRDMPS